MHSWLHTMDLEYGEKKLSGLEARYSRAVIRRYILDYAAALKQDCTMVWMDESYIHAGYCSRFSWYHQSEDVVPNRVRGSEKGKRLIIIHAMSKEGCSTSRWKIPPTISKRSTSLLRW